MNQNLEFKEFINKIAEYEFFIIRYILDIYKIKLINDYFSKHKVEVWHCSKHDKSILVASPRNMITDMINYKCYLSNIIVTCHLEFFDIFDEGFIKNNNLDLESYMKSFYDYNNDRFISVPLPVRLLIKL